MNRQGVHSRSAQTERAASPKPRPWEEVTGPLFLDGNKCQLTCAVRRSEIKTAKFKGDYFPDMKIVPVEWISTGGKRKTEWESGVDCLSAGEGSCDVGG